MEAKNSRFPPSKLFTKRLPTSKISFRRSLKKGSSILSKAEANSCKVRKSAAWAERCSVRIFLATESFNAGSCKISLWVDIKLAYSAPKVERTFFSHESNSSNVFCIA